MKQLSFDALQVAALYELYSATVIDGLQAVPAEDLAARIENGCTKGYLLVALADLEERGFVKFNSNSTSRSSAILPAGIRNVEKGLGEPNSPFSKFRDDREVYVEEREVSVRTAPAAGRVVPINHNSVEVKEISSGIKDLGQKIRMGNDIGDMSVDEAQAAIAEISQLEVSFSADFVRPDYVWSISKKTLKWISEKAAGAAVGKAAVALLAIIATFFGFNF